MMRVLVLISATCYLLTLSLLAYRTHAIEARLDSFQVDLNLLNADMQALDYLRRPAPLEAEPVKARTEYFI